MRKNWRITHGLSKSKTYVAWISMKQRTRYSSNQIYVKYYQDKRISISRRWEKFENFYADMGECPPGFTLDRINVYKGYSKKNCRWASTMTQAYNKTNSVKVRHAGHLWSPKEIAEAFNLKLSTVRERIRKGYTWRQLIVPAHHGQFVTREDGRYRKELKYV